MLNVLFSKINKSRNQFIERANSIINLFHRIIEKLTFKFNTMPPITSFVLGITSVHAYFILKIKPTSMGTNFLINETRSNQAYLMGSRHLAYEHNKKEGSIRGFGCPLNMFEGKNFKEKGKCCY